jgi:hypothetical protein
MLSRREIVVVSARLSCHQSNVTVILKCHATISPNAGSIYAGWATPPFRACGGIRVHAPVVFIVFAIGFNF